MVWPRCFRLAATVIGDRGLAEDAAQEACAIIHRKIGSLRSVEAFDSWVYRIVMREATRVRRRHRPPYLPADDAFVATLGSEAVDVWHALAALQPDLRDVTVLFYFDDIKTADIAKILGVANATVRTRLNRARERLRVLLNDYDDNAPEENLEVERHAF